MWGDLENTEAGARFVYALQGPTNERVFQRFCADPEGRRILAERRSIRETLTDRAHLRALPEGSRGRAYAAFMDAEDISNEGLVDATSDAAPFVGEKHLAGARVFPYLVPSQLRENERVMNEVYRSWTKPFLTAFGDSDPVTAGRDAMWREQVPGAAGQPHVTIEGGGHFIQEDRPDELVERMIAFIRGG